MALPEYTAYPDNDAYYAALESKLELCLFKLGVARSELEVASSRSEAKPEPPLGSQTPTSHMEPNISRHEQPDDNNASLIDPHSQLEVSRSTLEATCSSLEVACSRLENRTEPLADRTPISLLKANLSTLEMVYSVLELAASRLEDRAERLGYRTSKSHLQSNISRHQQPDDDNLSLMGLHSRVEALRSRLAVVRSRIEDIADSQSSRPSTSKLQSNISHHQQPNDNPNLVLHCPRCGTDLERLQQPRQEDPMEAAAASAPDHPNASRGWLDAVADLFSFSWAAKKEKEKEL